MTLLIRRSDIAKLLNLKQAMAVLERTFSEQSAGKVKQVPPLRLMNRGMRLVAGALEVQNKTGLRVSVTGGKSIALLFEVSSGELLAIMGYPFSELRISATVGLAIERLADPRAKSIALLGSGRLAMPLLEPAVALRKIECVRVYSRSPANRESFARKATAEIKLPVIAVDKPQTAIENSEIVLVSTNSPVAALCGEWLRPGISVFGVGRPNELDDEVYLRADLISVTSKTHELGYYDTKLDQPLIRLSRERQILWSDLAEFAHVLSGKIGVPDPASSIIVFRDSQGGYGDIALANWAYEEAKTRQWGQEISLE